MADRRPHVDEPLRLGLVAGHARDRVTLANQCGDQWLADRSTRTGNKDVHLTFSRLTFVVCTVGGNPSICSSSSSPGGSSAWPARGAMKLPKRPCGPSQRNVDYQHLSAVLMVLAPTANGIRIAI